MAESHDPLAQDTDAPLQHRHLLDLSTYSREDRKSVV